MQNNKPEQQGNKSVCIYTDGSVNKSQTKVGTAWLIAHGTDQIMDGKEFPISPPVDTTSLILLAEINAVIWALKNPVITADTPIKLYTDNKRVFNLVSQKYPDIFDHIRNGKAQATRESISELEGLIKDHKAAITPVLSSRNCCTSLEVRQKMTVVHNLAAQYAGASSIKTIPGEPSNLDALNQIPPIQWPPKLS